ncbi:MAG: hypothetical protein DHS20C21_12760 [Gemmatimonadota bacterium]|nr:MAG: hypothetical protein DHS20C21_12760 [Gemmatimonadota bacterium]
MRLAAALFLALLTPLAATAQDKIAYANVELILALMPETAQANRTMSSFQEGLGKSLRTKEEYAQQKLEEAQQAVAAGAPEAELEAFRTELNRLDAEIRKLAAESDRKMGQKRAELMDPVVERLSEVLRQIATEMGYDMILNAVDGSGTSVVLYGREDRDVTRAALDRLGIEVPDEAEE